MKTNPFYLMISFCAIISFHHCYLANQELMYGDGNIITETRSIDDVNSLGVYGSHDVNFIRSEERKIDIKIDSNLSDHLLTETNNGKLRIKTENNINLRPSKPISIKVYAPNIYSFSLMGSGSIDADHVKTENTELDINGSGDISLKTTARKVNASISGSGDMKIFGTADRTSFSISGSGDIDASELEAQSVEAKISGSGEIYCKASKSLTARISGSGDIIYEGNPKLESKTTGSGTISPKK
jgi:hypothetical protein